MNSCDDRNNSLFNILVISPVQAFPVDNGGAARLFNLYHRLSKKHRITWLCPIYPGTEEYVQEAGRYCDRLLELPREEHRPFPKHGWRRLLLRVVGRIHWARLFVFCFGYVEAPSLYWLPASPERLVFIQDLLSSNHFDLVVCEFEGNAELLLDPPEAPAVLALHNIQSSLFKRIRAAYPAGWQDKLFFFPELFKISRYERKNYSRFALATAVSELDRQILKQRCPDLPVELIPNGVDVNRFRPDPAIPEIPKSILYFGTFQTAPNVDAIFYFCREILPLIRKEIPDIQVLVVGRQPPEGLSQFEGVKVIGYVPDIGACVSQAEVVVVPVRVGGGTRLKIVEALALGKPVVSTRIGAEGLEVTHGKDILLADHPKGFAEHVIRLLREPELRQYLGTNGRRLVEEKYNWDILAEKLDKVFREVVNEHVRGHQPTSTNMVIEA